MTGAILIEMEVCSEVCRDDMTLMSEQIRKVCK